jgi:hypothetical protein
MRIIAAKTVAIPMPNAKLVTFARFCITSAQQAKLFSSKQLANILPHSGRAFCHSYATTMPNQVFQFILFFSKL